MNMLRRLPLLVCLGSTLLTGCTSMMAPKVDVLEPTQAQPVPVPQPQAANGSIFQTSSYRPLYESHRARMVGDIITIVIAEKIQAKQENSSTINKSGSASGSVTAFPFVSSASLLGKLTTGASSKNDFTGKGATSADNAFNGVITTTVIDVLPNGHLIVSGEKQIGVGQSVDILRFSGQVDPMTIQPGNSVSSTQVANVRVEQTGRGAKQEAQGIGWLGRFFLNISPF